MTYVVFAKVNTLPNVFYSFLIAIVVLSFIHTIGFLLKRYELNFIGFKSFHNLLKKLDDLLVKLFNTLKNYLKSYIDETKLKAFLSDIKPNIP
jgi:hypothetical protein